MKKSALKFIILLILLAFIAISVFISLRSDIEKQRVVEEQHQQFLAEELAKKQLKEEEEKRTYLLGKFNPRERPDFLPVPHEYTIGQDSGTVIYLREETLSAYLKMRNVAAQEGIDLKVASATRNFDYQRNIWDKKWSGYKLTDETERFEKILKYSAAPGTSRHHWGTEIDINDANPTYFDSPKGAAEYEWLTRSAYRFGFCQTYTEKSAKRATGYEEEKWHWSYLPLARNFTREYKKLIKEEDISGFSGEEYTQEQNLINDYVLGINPDCV